MKLIVPASTQEDINKCLEIRRQVFVVEKNVPEGTEVDEKDVPGSGCVHFLVYEDAALVGTFRIGINQNQVAKLQRFCLLKEYRHQGYGQYAMEFVEGFCEGQKVKKIVLDAQCSAVHFYERLGYTIFSEPFEEAGIQHVKMSKKISKEEKNEK